jgi:hypothetical protein
MPSRDTLNDKNGALNMGFACLLNSMLKRQRRPDCQNYLFDEGRKGKRKANNFSRKSMSSNFKVSSTTRTRGSILESLRASVSRASFHSMG